MRTIIGALAALAVLVGAMALAPQSVLAHADYDSSVPDRDEVVQEPPERVDVYFTQEVFKSEGANYVRVFDESDVQVSDGDGVVDDDDRAHIYAELPDTLAPGRYIVRWQSLSDIDGDSAEGAFCFYVAVEPTEAQAAECEELAGSEDDPTSTQPAATGEPDATPAPGQTDEPAATPSDGDTGGDDDDGVPAWAVVAGVIAGIAVLVIVVGGAVYWLRRNVE